MTRLQAGALTVMRGDAAILSEVSLAAAGGEFIGVVGPNGAGKSTLLRALCGVEPMAIGAIALDGRALGVLTPRQRARLIAYLPQTREVAWAITAEAVIALGRFAYGGPMRLGEADRAAVEGAMTAAGAASFRSRTMATLSGGEQARVHLARTLAAETPVVLADEPTAALDPRHSRAIMQALRSRADAGGLVIAALHDLRLAQRYCTRIVALDGGRVAADAAPITALGPALVERLFGVSAAEF